MNRSIVRLLVSAAFLSLPAFVSAGPGAAVISLMDHASHVVTAAYKSMADYEAYQQAVRLSAIIAGGDGAPSHIIRVGWANVAEMEALGGKSLTR